MSKFLFTTGLSLMLAAAGAWPAAAAVSAGRVTLSGHVPSVVAGLQSTGNVAGETTMHLAIGLPVRDADGLRSLVAQVSDPSSANYRNYLTPEQFTAQFGPTEQDFQAVANFAQANGLTVTKNHANRMLIEVSGSVSNVQRAFNVTIKKFQHPTEGREFFAPDTEPSVPAGLTVNDIGGLSDYGRPKPKLKFKPTNSASPQIGSGPAGNYIGYDFRSAYVPGTTLTGAGQTVALLQFDGYFSNDIVAYENLAGLPNITLTNVLLNGFSGIPTGTGGEIEVSLDIEMVASMSPGVSKIILYEGSPFNFNPNVVLNQIAVDNAARQVSCSWGWIGGPNATSDQIFLQMAVQGQSFFNASGDSDAFLPGQVDDPTGFGYPSCTPYITQVGGTTLTTSGGLGNWQSEKVWNWGLTFGADGVGSSGGVSQHYPIPTWQSNIDMTLNGGDPAHHNIPDVALTADNVFVIADNGIYYVGTGGTSCAAPLWAGFCALVNQQAAAAGQSSVGFLNPAIYAIGKGANYTNCFHDITVANNTWSRSPTAFYAVSGYDLCTGWGTPNGTNLINALVGSASGGTVISAPRPPYGTTLSGLNSGNPNGPWFLFVQDDAQLDSGIIANGWLLSLTTANPVGAAADNAVALTAAGSTIPLGGHWNVTLSVTNYGPSASTNIIVTDTLPAGVPYTFIAPTQGSVTTNAASLVWNVGNLAWGSGAAMTLTFTPAAIGTVTNSAVVDALTTDPNPDDNSANATTLVAVVSQPLLGNFAYANGGGTFQFAVTGSAVPTTIQASTNFINWVNLTTNTPPFTFTNLVTTNFPYRFYRAVQ